MHLPQNLITSVAIRIRFTTLLACLFCAIPGALAGTITVTTLNDGGPGSFRQAIEDAAAGDTIDFAVTGTVTLMNGQLEINKALTVIGPGPGNLILSGDGTSRVLLTTNGPILLSSLTLSNGTLPSASGPSGQFSSGGGILNFGTLVVSNCAIVGSRWIAPLSTRGGGIYNARAALTVIASTISGNLASSDGGGVHNDGIFRATNVTISSNVTFGDGGGIAQIFLGSTVALHGCTVVSNSSQRGGGFFDGGPAAARIRNTIIAQNSAQSGPDCWTISSLTSDDFNLIESTNDIPITGVTTHNIYGKDPLLGPLANNGGPTPTHALLPGSPAIDHGSSGGLATDQRGQPRAFNFVAYFDADDGSDIGAYELQERSQTGPVFTVNSNDDTDDGVAGIAHCSLREAIAAANANADTNTIDFAAEVPGVHTGVTGTITLTNGQLTLTNTVNINGPGAANLTVSGNNASRVFSFTNVTVAISGLTISNGGADLGGGINNIRGSLAISNCTVTGSGALNGGGVNNLEGAVTVFNCTISGNFAGSGGGGIHNLRGMARVISSAIVSNTAFIGAGIMSYDSNAVLTLTNSTVSGNGSTIQGGGIYNSQLAIFRSCTICSNRVSGNSGGGGIYGRGDIENCIIAGNSASNGPDCYGNFNSLDYNLIQNTNGATVTNLTAHNIYNQDPKLGPLADLGGPTPTHALRFDSPALDAGHSGGLTTDQRGLPRPIDDPNIPNADGGDGSEIGAYEADPNLRFTAIEKVDLDIRLRFNTVLGRTYRVDSKDDLNLSWSPLFESIIGDGSGVQLQNTGAANLPRRFYRAVLVAP